MVLGTYCINNFLAPWVLLALRYDNILKFVTADKKTLFVHIINIFGIDIVFDNIVEKVLVY